MDQEAEALRISSSLVADEAAGFSLVGNAQGGLTEVKQMAMGRPPGAGEVDQKAEAPRANSQLVANLASGARSR